ncbi:hypothetical protein JB92DRAFT_2835063 [Gautieria morchelliformis]|nr:hypothetical protein JB92DRAFT_2835063 [Gautieria morchelliformis]
MRVFIAVCIPGRLRGGHSQCASVTVVWDVVNILLVDNQGRTGSGPRLETGAVSPSPGENFGAYHWRVALCLERPPPGEVVAVVGGLGFVLRMVVGFGLLVEAHGAGGAWTRWRGTDREPLQADWYWTTREWTDVDNFESLTGFGGVSGDFRAVVLRGTALETRRGALEGLGKSEKFGEEMDDPGWTGLTWEIQ